MTDSIRRAALPILLATGVAIAGGCAAKETESLLLVQLKLATPGTQAPTRCP